MSYSKISINSLIAYVKTDYAAKALDLVKNQQFTRAIAIADFVIDGNGKLVKTRISINELIENYLVRGVTNSRQPQPVIPIDEITPLYDVFLGKPT